MGTPTKIRNSVAARVSLWVIILSGLVLLISATITYRHSSQTIERIASENVKLSMRVTGLEINSRLSNITNSVDNIALIVQNANWPLDTLFSVVKHIVEKNQDIVGSAIAFEPKLFKSKGYFFSPYAYEANGEILTKQLGNKDYDYFSMEWYQSTKEKGVSIWTKPYFDDGGGNMIMCTYSSPMYDKNGNFMGVVTADISLQWFEDLVSNLKPYDHSYAFAINNDGSYFMQGKYYTSKNNIFFTLAEHIKGGEALIEMGQEMIQGKSGICDIINNDGKKAIAIYSPLPHTDWSLAIISPKTDIFKDLYKSSNIILIIAICALAALFIVCRYIIGKLLRPLSSFATSADKIAKGDFDAELPTITSNDELLQLYNSFDHMKHDLVHYMETLSATASAKEKIKSELRIAHSIQMGLIPKIFPPFVGRTDIDLYAMLRPAKEVGGDLYDFFIEKEKLYFCIGDVSDKGIPAALFMAVVRSHFRSIAAILQDPKSIVNSLNQSLSENNDGNMFVTMIVGILDLQTGKIEYCNAGHNKPCLISSNGVSSFVEISKSLPIGIIPEAKYKKEELQLGQNETLFLYTDGLNEAENKDKQQYGNDRMIERIRFDHAPSAQETIETLEASVVEFTAGAPQSDDLTMLAIKYTGGQGSNKVSTEWNLVNKIGEINRLTEMIESACDQMQVGPAETMQITLAMEEAVTNVILYAYPKDGKEYPIKVIYTHSPSEMSFQIEDEGVPFNPLERPEVDTTLSAEERPIGGLGIHLIKKVMNSVEYCYRDGKNILTITKLR